MRASVIGSVVVTLLSGVMYFLARLYRHRSIIAKLRKQGIPMPKEWSWITGHLLTLQKHVEKLPPDANVSLALTELYREFADTEIFLMDYWPVYPPLFVVTSPDIASQISSKLNMPKSEQLEESLIPITGGRTMITMNGEEWKLWRGLFNPGFSAGSMMANMPHIVDYVQVFCERLQQSAGKDIVLLDDLTTRLTMDIIVKITLDANIDYQRYDNDLATALGYITRWHSFWDPRILMHPLRPFIQKYYSRVMDTYIRGELENRFTELNDTTHTSSAGGSKSVISLVLESYAADLAQNGASKHAKLDDEFARHATNQIRLFLFAGNDTTSSSIVFTYHMLHKHPKVLQELREEHDKVFGIDVSKAADILKRNPELLNKCRLTLAVIKETLRLYPPASTMRSPSPGSRVTDRHGDSYSLDLIGANIVHVAIHLNPRVWPRPTEFLPERFLVDSIHELHPDASAYRPFELGPRACIGQTLVYNEMRTALVLTARTFKITPAYDEWDALQAAKEGWYSKLGKKLGFSKPFPRTVNGERAYQTDKAGTHPADGYPCRVEVLEKSDHA